MPPTEPFVLKEGRDTVIISYGRMIENVMEAAGLLEKEGIGAKVIRLTEISNVPVLKLLDLIGDTSCVYIVEECVPGGSLASKLALELSHNGFKGKIEAVNPGNTIIPSASVEELLTMHSLDAAGIAMIVLQNPLVKC